jgi:cell division protein FtsB
LIRELKVENNNLIQQISDLEKLREENSQLRATIGELESENAKLFNRNKELEEENNKLKAENRALRNPPQIPAADVSSRFSKTSHDTYHQNKYKNLIKGKK